MTDQENSKEIIEQNSSEENLSSEEKELNPIISQNDDSDEDTDPDDELDENGNLKLIRENMIGDHKVASAVLTFEAQLPDYIVELIDKRISQLEEDDWESAMVGTSEQGAEVPDIRKCDVSWLTELDWVSTIFTHYFRIANRELWEYDLTEMEEIQVTRYNRNNFYGWHSDYGTSGDKTLTRKLSASIVLSDPNDYSGGKLQFIDWHGKVVTTTKKKGSIIIFDSRTPHRVTPVLKGQRISLVAWMLGPKLK
jgi:PKHD-type hydroxylase